MSADTTTTSTKPPVFTKGDRLQSKSDGKASYVSLVHPDGKIDVQEEKVVGSDTEPKWFYHVDANDWEAHPDGKAPKADATAKTPAGAKPAPKKGETVKYKGGKATVTHVDPDSGFVDLEEVDPQGNVPPRLWGRVDPKQLDS